jgi:hypothetical protein
MNISHCSQIGIFKQEMQTEIDKAWAGSGEYAYTKSLTIPSKITYICFGDKNKASSGAYKEYFRDFQYGMPENNFFFIPMSNACDFKTLTIKHVNIEKTTSVINPYCIPVKNGKVDIKINKGITDALVCIGINCGTSNIFVSSNVCSNAERDERCDYLDIDNLQGYRQECCTTYSKCC